MAQPTQPTPGSVGVGPDTSRGEVTGEPGDGQRRVQRTINFDRGVLDRARAAATYLAAREPASGVRSLADIVNLAVAARVAELEKLYNDGKPFRPVYRMPPGRPSRN
ncbi:hypothetical protein [Streptoalloteichus hindustanus]|uniref:Uncharacterized protein n=1 Tax=Streptoalloteichus hindustanus TaxID=2017 RepID=A0A1M5NQA7_STRHI|nr:hypothetical protein [Streptoalloteichus hindustanus]SHG91746.1 hypothetical protein SAMN05444320_11674 [Streptoalloteichus hindustanus]